MFKKTLFLTSIYFGITTSCLATFSYTTDKIEPTKKTMTINGSTNNAAFIIELNTTPYKIINVNLINQADIDDLTLERLQLLTSLRSLNVENTSVTQQGVAEFKSARSDIEPKNVFYTYFDGWPLSK